MKSNVDLFQCCIQEFIYANRIIYGFKFILKEKNLELIDQPDSL